MFRGTSRVPPAALTCPAQAQVGAGTSWDPQQQVPGFTRAAGCVGTPRGSSWPGRLGEAPTSSLLLEQGEGQLHSSLGPRLLSSGQVSPIVGLGVQSPRPSLPGPLICMASRKSTPDSLGGPRQPRRAPGQGGQRSPWRLPELGCRLSPLCSVPAPTLCGCHKTPLSDASDNHGTQTSI